MALWVRVNPSILNKLTHVEGRRIRTIAIGIVERDDGSILVGEGYDRVKKEIFYRPLGGTIEFGETGKEALGRELKEEIAAEVSNVRFLGTVENIFTFDGKPGHEIVLVYRADLKNRGLYKQEVIEGLETFPEGVMTIRALWKSLKAFRSHDLLLYPSRLLELLDRKAVNAS